MYAPSPRKLALGGISLEHLIILAGAVAMSHSAMGMIIPLMPMFIGELGGAAVAVGLAFSVQSGARFLTNIPAGILAERLGRKWVIAGGSVLVGLFASLSGTAPLIVLFLGYRFASGIGSAMVQTASSVAITDLTTVDNRGRALGLIHGVQLITGILSPAIGGLLAEFVDIRAPFFVSGIGSIIFGIWAIVRLPETRPIKTSDGTVNHSVLSASSFDGIRRAASLLAGPSFFLACMLAFAQFFTRAGTSHSLVLIYANNELGLSAGELGALFSVVAVLHSLLVYPAGIIADRYGRKLVITPANLMLAISAACFPFTDNTLQFALVFIALHTAVGWGGQAPVAYLGDIAPADARGLSFGLYRTFGDLAGIIAPLTLTTLVATSGYIPAFGVNALLVLAITAAFHRFGDETAGTRRKRNSS